MNLKNLSLLRDEKENIESNLLIVKENLKENNVEQLDYDEIKKIQDPEPIIIIPENLAPFVPKSIIYLTKFVPKDLNIKRFKSYQKKKLAEKIPYSKKEKLIDKKAGVVRTISELKLLKENNEIPDELAGVWRTSAPKYKDCFFDLNEHLIIFANGHLLENIDVNFISKIKNTHMGSQVLYIIYYENLENQEFKLSFYYDPSNGGVIRFKNQEKIKWWKEKYVRY